MSKWKVIKNPIGGEYVFQVVKQIRDNEPLHSGNMHVAGSFNSREEAEAWALRRNEEEGTD